MRRLFILCALLAVATPIAAKAPAATTTEIASVEGRKIPLTTWAADKPKGVVIFGHGLGGEPAAYASLLTRWQDAGYTVVAPLNVDSHKYADRAKFDRMSGFMARVTDLMVVRNHVGKAYAGMPVVLAGHSYGTLFSLYGAGAAGPTGPLPFLPAAGVIALSSPGAIPMLVTRSTFAPVAVPVLTITGDADTIPGFVPDWKAHRLPFDTSKPGGKTLIIFNGGGHDVVIRGSKEQQDAAAALTIDFLDSVAGGDARAKARLASVKSNPLYQAEQR